MQHPLVTHFFDEPTNTFSYIVQDPDSSVCAIIDSVLDFDYAAGRTDVRSADKIIEYVQSNDLSVEWVLETHVHADHLSAAPYLHERLGGKTGIGEKIAVVQEVFGKAFNAGTDFARDGSQFDRLFKEGDTFMIGNLEASVLHTPGHTPACLTYVIGDAAFVGDTLFAPDAGTARCDFPGATPIPFTTPFRKSWRFPEKPAFSFAMTTKRRGAMSLFMRRPSPSNVPATSMWATISVKTSLLFFAQSVTPSSECPD